MDDAAGLRAVPSGADGHPVESDGTIRLNECAWRVSAISVNASRSGRASEAVAIAVFVDGGVMIAVALSNSAPGTEFDNSVKVLAIDNLLPGDAQYPLQRGVRIGKVSAPAW